MQLNEIDFSGLPPIDGYGPGFFRVGGAIHRGPLALLPDGPRSWPGLPEIEIFLAAASEVDVVFLGTGPEIRPLAAELRVRLEGAGIGVEIMATPPACRTYNVLLAEGRRIAAGLLPV